MVYCVRFKVYKHDTCHDANHPVTAKKALLEHIVRNAPGSRDCFPEHIHRGDIRGTVEAHLRFMDWHVFGREALDRNVDENDGVEPDRNCKIYQEIIAARERVGGIGFFGNAVCLLPVVPEPSYTLVEDLDVDEGEIKSLKWMDCLVSFSTLDGQTDFFRILSEHGVWGHPASDMPTYLQQTHACISHFSDRGQRIVLFVDKEKLMRKRAIFLDPESLEGEGANYLFYPGCPEGDGVALLTPRDVLGKSFFVCGGIPHEAIHSYKFLI